MDPEQKPARGWSLHKGLTIALQAIIVIGIGFSIYERQVQQRTSRLSALSWAAASARL